MFREASKCALGLGVGFVRGFVLRERMISAQRRITGIMALRTDAHSLPLKGSSKTFRCRASGAAGWAPAASSVQELSGKPRP